MASSSLSSARKPKYDVFLSFRGEDTRKGFTNYLYISLQSGGINTFRDDNEIQSGMTISPQLLTAIEASKIAIVVISKNYAFSTWCLEELVKIFQCKKELGMDVIPIFYDVDPSDVRKQNGRIAEAFVKHEEVLGADNLRVKRWRQVLSEVADLKGWTSEYWQYELDLIKEIYEAILKKIQPTLKVSQEHELVGIRSKLKLLTELLDTKSSGVISVGIWGMRGIGKTTIARVAYGEILREFEVHCFLSEVRENCKSHGVPYLQSKLLSRIVTTKKSFDILDADEGLAMIKKVLQGRKVLLVLDDVDEFDQIYRLVPKQNALGCGSRIIITTTDENLLETFGVERRCKIQELNDHEALQLLSLNAFMEKYPKDGYLNPCKSIVKLAGGLPLALQVLGSSLRNKDVVTWNNAVEALQSEGVVDHEDKIFKVLKISFDGLDEKEKDIFLDIACFFKGKKRDHVVEILDGCGFNATRRIEFLIEKSLIRISNNDELWMHDLLQEMGRKIAHQEFHNRLWCQEDIKNMVKEEAIQSIHCKAISNVKIQTSFSRMHKLRLLNVHNVQLHSLLEDCIPTNIRYLKWKEYPLEFLSLSDEENELMELHMCRSNLKECWRGEKNLEKLKHINLSNSQKLSVTPDFAKVPNLKRLNLKGCRSLVNIHPSIFVARRLVYLNLKDCINLTSLPSCIKIEVLEVLILSGCSKIKKIPEFTGNTNGLLQLCLDGTSIHELPSSVGDLSGLILLNLKNCRKLVSLPSTIGMLKSLRSLDASGCPRLGNHPKKLSDSECLEEGEVRRTVRREGAHHISFQKILSDRLINGVRRLMPQLFEVPPSGVFGIPSLAGLSSLTELDLSDCNLGLVPDGICSLSTLTDLILSGNNFSHLPTNISQLTNLQTLNVERCQELLSFPELPPRMYLVQSSDCISLRNIPDISKLDGFLSLKNLDLSNCYGIADNQESYRSLMAQIEKEIFGGERLTITFPGSEVPKWFTATNIGEGGSLSIELGNANNRSVSYALFAIFGPSDPEHTVNVPFVITAQISHINSDKSDSQKLWCFSNKVGVSQMKLDHIWIISDREKFSSSCKGIELSFNIQIDDRYSTLSSIKVKKFGICLINVEERTEETMMQGDSEGGLSDAIQTPITMRIRCLKGGHWRQLTESF